MCFKKTVLGIALAGACAVGLPASPSPSEVLDCLLAVVNDRPITLVDIRILEAFDLFREEGTSGRRALLDKWIDLKCVIDLVKERVTVTPERVAAARDAALADLGAERRETALRDFGLTPEDLLPYIEQQLLFEEIVSLRFSRGAMVTLGEIEGYYREVYVPEERARGQEPRPILDVLDRLEAVLKAVKIKRQAASWVANLRRQAEVQVLEACLDALGRE